MKAPLLIVSALCVAACTRSAGTPQPEPNTVPTIRDPGPLTALRGNNPAEELMEKAEGISEFPGTSQGLEQLFRALQTAVQANNMPRIEELVEPVLPERSQFRLALTFEGGNTLAPYLTGPAGITQDDLEAKVREWGTATSFTVRSATGTEIAQGANATAYDPAMRRIGSLLREGVSFYRVELQLPGGRTAVSESWIYAGGKWMYLQEPWRFAPGAPERGQVMPTHPIAADLPSGGL